MSPRQATSWSTCMAVLLYAMAQTATAQPCPGDCDADGQVSLAEAVLALRISLDRGGAQLSDCPAADVDLNGVVSVGDAMRAAAAMQNGCTGAAAAGSAGATTSGAGGTPFVEVSMESGAPGETVEFSVTLHTAGQDIAGVEQEIHLVGLTPVLGCQVNPAINKNASAFALRPSGCSPGVTCTSLKALILSFTNVDPIPDGSVLFTCEVSISGAAPGGVYPLDSRLEGAADPDGNEVLLDGVDGSISVAAVPTATPTPIPVQASLILEKVRLKADTADRPGRDNGTIAVVGVVNANDPFANFVEDIGASGLSVRVSGAGGVDEVLPWSAAECEVRAAAGGPRIRCSTADAAGKRKIDLRTTRVPNLFRAKLAAKRLGFPPPLTAGTVAVVLTTATFERSDTIGGCKLSGGGRKSTCRESGFVPTPTPTFTSTPTPTFTFTVTPTPTDTPILPDDTTIVVGDAIGVPGGTVAFTVGLETGEQVAATQNELHLDPGAPLSFVSCAVHPDLDKNLFYNISTPSDLTAIVISLVSLDPIPHGSTMYTCEIGIGATAPAADYLIDCTNPDASDPSGNPIATLCSDGTLTVTP